jgi:hypothetical protein
MTAVKRVGNRVGNERGRWLGSGHRAYLNLTSCKKDCRRGCYLDEGGGDRVGASGGDPASAGGAFSRVQAATSGWVQTAAFL